MKNTTCQPGAWRRLLFVLAVMVLVFSVATPSLAWFARAIYRQLTDAFAASSVVSYFAGGTGTEGDPYQITMSKHLYNLAWLQNSGVFDATTHFVLNNDIDMAGSINGQDTTGGAIPPIGTNTQPFVGHFDGNGCVISNLWVSTDINDWKERPEGVTGYASTHVGLFGAISGDAIVENFNLDRVEIKSHIDATIGIICGLVDANISGVGVYNGILTVASGVTCQSEYSLLGEISSNVNWVDKPTVGTGSGEGDSGSGGDLVIDPAHFDMITGSSVAAGSALAVDGALTGTAFYVGQLTVKTPGGPAPVLYDMTEYKTNGTVKKFAVDTAADNADAQQKILEAYNDYKTNKRYLYSSGVPSASATVTASYTINGEARQITIPANGVWFKPQAAGTAALAFAKSNNNADKTMAIYKYQRNGGTLTQVDKTTFVLPKAGFKNGYIVYYEYEITEADVEAGYEYVIGASNTGATDGSVGFVAMALAGTDTSSGDNPGGSGENPGATRKVMNVDYVVGTEVQVSAADYEIHQTLLQIPSGTTTAEGTIYYKAVGEVGASTVNYYVPSMGISVTDISQAKQSAAASDTSQFAPRDETAP